MRPAQIVLLLIFALSALSAALAFGRYYIQKEYWVFANVDCDPAAHSCFIGDGDATPKFYEKISKKAYAIPPCNGWADECKPLTCAPEESAVCTITYCVPGSGDDCYAAGRVQ